jgi:hypothetical protein
MTLTNTWIDTPNTEPDTEHDEETMALLKAAEEAADNPPVPFPLHALNEAQRGAVEEMASVFQQDPSVAGMVSIAGLAGAIGRSLVVEGASKHQTPANVLMIVAAPRSYGKSTSRQMLEPLFNKNKELAEEWQAYARPLAKADIRIASVKMKRAESDSKKGEDRRQEIAELEREIERATETLKAAPMVVLSGNFTMPSLTEMMAGNKGQLMSFDPEAADTIRICLGKFNDGKSDIGLILSAYTGEAFGEGRIGRGASLIENPSLTSCWLCQPHLLTEMLENREALERGLGARMLYTMIPEAPPPFNDGRVAGADRLKMSPWFSVLESALVRRETQVVAIKATQEAGKAFLKYDNEVIGQRRTIHRDIQGELGRCAENAIRLALGQAAADAFQAGEEVPEELTLDHATRGIALARYSYDQYIRLLAASREERSFARLDRIIEILRKHGESRSIRDLKNSNGFTEEEVKILAAQYPHRLRIEVNQHEKGGRPSSILHLVSVSSLINP